MARGQDRGGPRAREGPRPASAPPSSSPRPLLRSRRHLSEQECEHGTVPQVLAALVREESVGRLLRGLELVDADYHSAMYISTTDKDRDSAPPHVVVPQSADRGVPVGRGTAELGGLLAAYDRVEVPPPDPERDSRQSRFSGHGHPDRLIQQYQQKTLRVLFASPGRMMFTETNPTDAFDLSSHSPHVAQSVMLRAWAGYVLNDSSTREWTLSTRRLQRYQNATLRSKRRARARASTNDTSRSLEEARERPEGVDGPGGDQPPDRGARYSCVAVRTPGATFPPR